MSFLRLSQSLNHNCCKIKSKLHADLRHAMAQNTHYHPKREEWGHSEEILDESKSETQQEKLQTP